MKLNPEENDIINQDNIEEAEHDSNGYFKQEHIHIDDDELTMQPRKADAFLGGSLLPEGLPKLRFDETSYCNSSAQGGEFTQPVRMLSPLSEHHSGMGINAQFSSIRMTNSNCANLFDVF